MATDKELQQTLKMYQEQTCGNFGDLNDDMDDVRGHLLDIKAKLDTLEALLIQQQKDGTK